jgi:hypothetical protein
MAFQASLIIWMTVEIHEGNPTNPIGMVLAVNVIIVAFLTAALTRLWDWLRRRARIVGQKSTSDGSATVVTGSQLLEAPDASGVQKKISKPIRLPLKPH